MKRVLMLVLGLLGSGIAARSASSQGVIVRIPDGATSRCINGSSDQIWLTMRRVILKRDAGLFTKDKYAGVVVSTTISGNSGTKTEKVSFPRMIEADIQGYREGNGVSIPVEFGLLEGLQLHMGTTSYSNVDFDFNVIKGKKRSGWGDALNALVQVTKKLPLPSNAFTDGFLFFADYANSVVDQSVQARKQDNLKQGTAHLSFSPNGQCPNKSFESTGTLAVVFTTPGTEADGVVDIAKINNNEYCWSADLQPAFAVKFGKRSATGQCQPTIGLSNDYYGFFLNAVPSSIGGAPSLREDLLANSNGKFMDEVRPAAIDSVFQSDTALSRTARTAAKWNPQKSSLPYGSVVAMTKDSLTIWRATELQSAAFDINEALRRCQAHGIAARACLRGSKIPLSRYESRQ